MLDDEYLKRRIKDHKITQEHERLNEMGYQVYNGKISCNPFSSGYGIKEEWKREMDIPELQRQLDNFVDMFNNTAYTDGIYSL